MNNTYTDNHAPDHNDYDAMLDILSATERLTLDWMPVGTPNSDPAAISYTTDGRHFYRVFADHQKGDERGFGVEQIVLHRKQDCACPTMDKSAVISVFQTGGFGLFADAVRWCEMTAALNDY